MNTHISHKPNENIATEVAAQMTGEKVVSCKRMTTGDQYFVYGIGTEKSEYVIRMTDVDRKRNFISAIYWQEKLIPLRVQLAKFIKSDLEEKYSPFPTLLMKRVPGDDLCNIYSTLTTSDKKNLAEEMVGIQALTDSLPQGLSYGIASSYEQITEDKSWYNFLDNRLQLFKKIIKQSAVFDENEIEKVILIASNINNEFSTIQARPFLWDASERNVLVHKAKITGIVDVDDMCFGDPLFVIALTAVALELENHDTQYTDYWAEALRLDKDAQIRLAFYKLFYTVVFMRKHAMTTTNNQIISFNVSRLNTLLKKHFDEMYSLL